MSALLEININGDVITLHEDIKTFIYEQVTKGSSMFLIEGKIDSTNWNMLDPFISDPDSNVQIRWGFTEEGNKWSNWHSIIASKVNMGYDVDTVRYLIQGHDLGFKLSENKTDTLYKDKLVSAIVQQIAGDNVISSEVTGTSGEYTIIQDVNDGKFIMDYLLPMAYNGSSKSFVFYFKDGNKLMFEPLETSKVYTQFSEVYTGVYIGNPSKFSDRLNVEYRSFDPYKREFLAKEVNDSSAGYRKLSGKTVYPPSGTNKVDYIDNIDKELFRELATTKWHDDYIKMHDFVCYCQDPKMPVNQLIDITVKDVNGANTLATGRYVITRNRVEIRGTEYMNLVFISRRGA